MRKLFFTILFLTTAILIIGFNTANAASNITLDFDGTSDYLVAVDNAVFDQADRLSISVWIQPDNTPDGDEYIVYRFNDYYLKMDDNRKIIGSVHTDAETVTSTSAITCDGVEYTHIEMTYDKDAGGTDELKIYIDGVLDGRGDYSTANAVSAELLYIGAADTDGLGVGVISNWFDGKIDDVRLYQYARSASDVRLDYNNGLASRFGGLTSHSSGGQTSTLCARDPASCMDYGLVGHWNMDEAGGDTLYDQSDNGNDGTLGSGVGADTSDPKWVGGQTSSQLGGGLASTALSFDGKDDYVNCGNDSSLDITDAITIEAWVKWSVVAGANETIISRGSQGVSKFYWLVYSNGKYYWQIGDGSTYDYTTYITTPTPGIWYHIVATFDKGATKIYIDGVEVVADTLTVTSCDDIGYNLTIGRYSDSNNYFFPGSIDGVKIYNRALSAEEVRYHYNRGGPVAHWKFDEGEGATAYDESGNRNHGVLTGSTSGTADSGSTTTLVDTALTQAEDYWKDYTLKIVTTTDALAPQGETATITGFAAGTDTLSFAALTAAVAADDTYKLYSGDEHGPTWVAGKHFGSLSFDGTDDYIDCGNDSTLDITDAITIEAWVKVINNTDGVSNYIVTKSDGSSGGGGYLLARKGNSLNQIFFFLADGTVPSPSFITTNAITLDRWVHVVVTWNGLTTSGSIKIYFDGVEQSGSESNYGTTPASNNLDVIIGKYTGASSGEFLNGSIDDVKIYNYARTPAQILIDYNAGLGTHIK